MPLNFILEIILMVSLGAMIYLIARAVPRISDIVPDEESVNKGLGEKLSKFVDSLPVERADLTISRLFERMLRSMKLLVMRVDNKLSQQLARFKAKIGNGDQNGKKPTLFEELNADENKETKSIAENNLEPEDLTRNKK